MQSSRVAAVSPGEGRGIIACPSLMRFRREGKELLERDVEMALVCLGLGQQ